VTEPGSAVPPVESKQQSWGEVGLAARHARERHIRVLLVAASAVSILTTVGIVAVLLFESLSFFAQVSPITFLTGTRWTPLFQDQHFGVLPLLTGSLLVAGGAALLALPIGLASAIYLSEYADERVRRVIKPVLEVLAGVPTVVYGYFALLWVTPVLRTIWPTTEIFNAASASIVIGIMIIPMVSSLSEDAMSAVPRALREGAYALGATRFEVCDADGRAGRIVGDHCIVHSGDLAGHRRDDDRDHRGRATPRLTLNPLEGVQTMTAYIAQTAMGELPHGSWSTRRSSQSGSHCSRSRC
jgi:phosphate transport system permease protein